MVLYFLTDFYCFNFFHPWVLSIFYGVVHTSISEASVIQCIISEVKENVDTMITAIFCRLIREGSSVSV